MSNFHIGERRVSRIAEEEKLKGNIVHSNRNWRMSVDLVIIDRETLTVKRVYECTNYKHKWEYIKIDRASRYLNSLLEYKKAEKILVVSYKENLRCLPKDFFSKYGIKVVIVGYQD